MRRRHNIVIMSNNDLQYNTSPENLRLVKLRNERKQALRQEYLMKITDPHRHATGEGGSVVSFAR